MRYINVIKIFLGKAYDIDKISSRFADDVCKAREVLWYLYPVSECSRTTSNYYANQVSSPDLRWLNKVWTLLTITIPISPVNVGSR